MGRKLVVGDRVIKKGLFRGEVDRLGEVVECYNGRPSALDPGVELMAVKFDDTGTIERGYLNGNGSSLEPEPLRVPTMMVLARGPEEKG